MLLRSGVFIIFTPFLNPELQIIYEWNLTKSYSNTLKCYKNSELGFVVTLMTIKCYKNSELGFVVTLMTSKLSKSYKKQPFTLIS